MKSHLALFVALALGGGLLAGCQTGGAKPPINTTKYNLENHAQFVLLDSGTQRSVTCSGIQKTLREDGRLEVVANIRNRENRRIQVQVNCEFKDGQGFTVDSTAWKSLFLDENATEGVPFISMNNKASDFTIRVRQAR